MPDSPIVVTRGGYRFVVFTPAVRGLMAMIEGE